jgi:hypothetical protein
MGTCVSPGPVLPSPCSAHAFPFLSVRLCDPCPVLCSETFPTRVFWDHPPFSEDFYHRRKNPPKHRCVLGFLLFTEVWSGPHYFLYKTWASGLGFFLSPLPVEVCLSWHHSWTPSCTSLSTWSGWVGALWGFICGVSVLGWPVHLSIC